MTTTTPNGPLPAGQWMTGFRTMVFPAWRRETSIVSGASARADPVVKSRNDKAIHAAELLAASRITSPGAHARAKSIAQLLHLIRIVIFRQSLIEPEAEARSIVRVHRWRQGPHCVMP
jgi:hypothetical protein